MKNKYLILKFFIQLLLLISAGWICTSYSQDSMDGWTRLKDIPHGQSTRSYCHLDGKIYVIGGFSEGIITASMQVYDIASNQWELVANMNQNRGAATAHSVADKIYVISGHGFGGIYPDSVNVEEYDPGTDSWTMKNNIPKLFWAHSSCLYNDSIYVFGGTNTTDGSLSSVFVYDPQTDIWESLPDMNHAIYGPACCVCNDKIYAFGGMLNDNSMINEVEVYDPATGAWEEEKPNNMPEATWSSWIALYEGKITLFGGLNEETEYFNFVYQYNPVTDTFIRMQDLPFKCGGGLQVNNYVYFLDGTSGSIYDPNNEIWRFNLDSLKEYTGGETSIKQPLQDANNSFVLHQNYPNPFSGSTHISYELTEPGEVQLEIFNILGEKIITLVNESQNPGSYEVWWNAEGIQPGIYFCRLKVAGFEKVTKLIVSH